MKKLFLSLLAGLLLLNLSAQDLVPYFNPIGKDWGYCDWYKKSVIFPQFEEAGLFYNGLAIVRDNGLYGVINPRGQFVVECKYKKIYPFSEGFAAVLSKDDRIGFIDSYGEEVVPCKYDYDKYDKFRFSEGRAFVKSGDRYGYVDVKGNQVIDFKFSSARDFHDGFAIVFRPDEGAAFIDPQGKIIADLKDYTYFEEYREGLVGATKGKKQGFLDKTGKVVIPFDFTSVTVFSEGLTFVKNGKKQMFIDKTGKPVINLKCDEMYYTVFSDGLANIEKDDMVGFIDKSGKMAIPFNYESAGDFKNGWALVSRSVMEGNNFVTYSGIIDKTGKPVLPIAYKVMNDDEVLPGWLLYTYEDPVYTYVNFNGVSYSDVYRQYTTVASVEELFKPKAEDYPKYIVGNYANFDMTDQNGNRYRSPLNNFGEYFSITDQGNGIVKLEFKQEATLDGLVGDGYLHTFTGTFDFTVSYGDLGSTGFTIGKIEKEGFILNNPQGIVKVETGVESAWGIYKVKADELTIYVNMADGKNYTIRGKRDYTN